MTEKYLPDPAESAGSESQEVERRIEAIDHKLDVIGRRLDAMDARLNAVDRRFNGMNGRFSSMEGQFHGVHGRFTAIIHRLDRQTERIDWARNALIKSWDQIAQGGEDPREELVESLQSIVEGCGLTRNGL